MERVLWRHPVPPDRAAFAAQARALNAAMDDLAKPAVLCCTCGKAPKRPKAANCRACHAKAQGALRARQAAELALLRANAARADRLLRALCPIDLRKPLEQPSG